MKNNILLWYSLFINYCYKKMAIKLKARENFFYIKNLYQRHLQLFSNILDVCDKLEINLLNL